MVAFIYHDSVVVVNDENIVHLHEDIVNQIPVLRALTRQDQLTGAEINEPFVLPSNITPQLLRTIHKYIKEQDCTELLTSQSLPEILSTMDFLGLGLPVTFSDLEESLEQKRKTHEEDMFKGADATQLVTSKIGQIAAVILSYDSFREMNALEHERSQQKWNIAMRFIFLNPAAFIIRIRKDASGLFEPKLQRHLEEVLSPYHETDEDEIYLQFENYFEFDTGRYLQDKMHKWLIAKTKDCIGSSSTVVKSSTEEEAHVHFEDYCELDLERFHKDKMEKWLDKYPANNQSYQCAPQSSATEGSSEDESDLRPNVSNIGTKWHERHIADDQSYHRTSQSFDWKDSSEEETYPRYIASCYYDDCHSDYHYADDSDSYSDGADFPDYDQDSGSDF